MGDYEYSEGDTLCCPYCKHEFEFTGDPLDQDEEIEVDCPECGKEYVARADYSRSFNNYKKHDVVSEVSE